MSAFPHLISHWRGGAGRLALVAVVLPASFAVAQAHPTPTPSGRVAPNASRGADSLAVLRHIDAPPYPSALRAVIADPETLRRLWASPGSASPVPPPTVDFAREMVILVALGSWPDTGAGIRIDSLTTSDSPAGLTTTVFLHVGISGRYCVVGPAFTNPGDAVVMPRNAHVALIQFHERLVEDSCPLSQWQVRRPAAPHPRKP